MPNQATLAEIEIAELTQTVDDGRAPADPFKLPAGLRTLKLRQRASLVGVAQDAKRQNRHHKGGKTQKFHCRIPEQPVPWMFLGRNAER